VDPLAGVLDVPGPQPPGPRLAAAQIEQDQPALDEAQRVEVGRDLIEGALFGLRVAPDLHLEDVAGALPLDDQIEGAAAERVLALDAAASRRAAETPSA